MAKIRISDEAKKVALELHNYCKAIHPAVSAKVKEARERTSRPSEKEKWTRLINFLNQYKPDKLAPASEPEKMDGLKSNLFRLAREFELALNRPVPPYIGLFGVLKERLGPDGRIQFFFNNNSASEPDYADVVFDVSKKQLGEGVFISREAQEKHDLVYGDLDSVTSWLKTAASTNLKNLENKLIAAVTDNQFPVISHLIDYMKFRHIPEQRINDIMQYLKNDYDQTAMIPLYYPPLLRPVEKQEIQKYKDLATKYNLPLDFMMGNSGLENIEEKNINFDRETYKKIRNFLAYEVSSLVDLNSKATMATLLFPNYLDFVAYVSKRARLNPENNALRLGELFDDSNFTLSDMDYPSWGQALLQQPDDVFFYFKCAKALTNIPKDKQGRILVGDVRDQLYDKIEYCFERLTDYDIERCELPLVTELRDIKAHQAKYSHLPDRCINMPDMPVAGEDFSKPGWELKRVSYEDIRLYMIGRYTGGNCEVLNKMWGETIRHAIETRKSAFYVIADDTGKWRAHSWVYPEEIGLIKFAGWEADPADKREMNEALFENVNAAIRQHHSVTVVEFGKASRHLNIVPDYLTADWDREQHDEHKKEVNERILDLDDVMNEAGVARYDIVTLDSIVRGPKAP